VYAWGDEIPDYLPIDLRGRRINEKIMASDVILADGLTMVRPGSLLFCAHAHLLSRHCPPTLQRKSERDYAVAKFVGTKRTAAELAAKAAEPKTAAKAAPKAAEKKEEKK
jgi:hypothetical protein